jgi:divalent metal cation (Fe/Co/Zn/Cd) transporter
MRRRHKSDTLAGLALLAVLAIVVFGVLQQLIGTAGIGLLLLAVGVILFIRSYREGRHQ